MFLRSCCTILFLTTLVAGEIADKIWWRNAIFYQICPRSFMDSNGDGIGDLNGIASKLDHFVESGIGGLWLSPINKSPMIDFGYDVADYYAIDETYGTMADLEALTAKAETLGLKLVLDFVPNHTSDKHEWFIKSSQGIDKYADYYVWRVGRENNTKPPNNWLSVFEGPAWTFNATRGMWYLHQFDYRQPDLNLTNPDVLKEMEDILRFWLDKGIDGFRVDAVPFFFENDDLLDEPLSNIPGLTEKDHDYLEHVYTLDDPRNYGLVQSWKKVIDDYADSHNQDEKVLMTESFTNITNAARYYNYSVDMPFNFMLIKKVSNTSKPSDIIEVINDWMTLVPVDGAANWVIGSHDVQRVASRYPGRVNQMTMLAMVLPGVAVTYYGEEIGMDDKSDISWEDTQDPQACNTDPDHYLEFSRDPFRTPYQWDDSTNAGFSNATKTWLPVNADYKDVNLAKQKADPESHYKLYQTMTKLRSTSVPLRNGTLETAALNDNSVLAIIRKNSDEGVALLINFSDDAAQTVDISTYLPNASGATVKAASVGSGITWESTVNVTAIQVPSKVSLLVSYSSVK